MKCPSCWADKAYRHQCNGWTDILLACLLMVPMKCHHCYHRFRVFWPLTIGRRTDPPVLRNPRAKQAAGASYAARHYAATHNASDGRRPNTSANTTDNVVPPGELS